MEPLAEQRNAPSLQSLRAVGYAGHDPLGETAERELPPSDSGQVAPGWNLTTDEVEHVLAYDAAGEQVLSLAVPGRTQVEHAEPVAAGLLTVSVDEGWDLLGRDGAHRWSLDGQAHHDVAERADGLLLGLAWEEREYRGRRVRFDTIVALDPDEAQPAVLWSSFEAREALSAHHEPLPLDRAAPPESGPPDTVYDYHHLNTLEVLPDPASASGPGAARLLREDGRFRPGSLLLCARNASLVFVLDPSTGAIAWSAGPGLLDFPHTPTLTPRGTVLVFDNGWHRGWSRAVELDPRSGAVVWSYEADPREGFFTRTRGSAQRLSNGNTLLCEAERGLAFEVTPAGERVWSLRNPIAPLSAAAAAEHGGVRPGTPGRRRFYRVTRFEPVRLTGER